MTPPADRGRQQQTVKPIRPEDGNMIMRKATLLTALWVLLVGAGLHAQTPGSAEDKPADKILIYWEEYIQKQFKELML